MVELTNMKRAAERWRREGVRLLPPADDVAVVERLKGLGRLISGDVVELYRATGGMDSDMDSNCWSLWPLDRVTSENNAGGHPFLLFSDFLINSHLYGLRYESADESSVYVIGEDRPEKVAGSLDEFFHFSLNDPGKVWM